MSITHNTSRGLLLLGACLGMAIISGNVQAAKKVFEPLNEAEFETAKGMYFQRCAGCHGVLRKGATGKSLLPEPNKAKKSKGTLKLGTKRLSKIIKLGTEGGMNNFSDIFSDEEINLLARYIQMEPPIPPEMSLALMKERHKVYIEPKDYPDKPLHGRNWENFFVVIERDAGKIAIIDGDKHEIVDHIDTGYAVHVVKATEHHDTETPVGGVAGRFWYTQGRDGKMTKIDLWQNPGSMLVAEAQMAYDARDVAVSGDGKYVIGGAYWPPHFVILDAVTMEPLKVVSTRGINVDGDYINESRVAAIYTTPGQSSFWVALKELGQMWQVDYRDLDNLAIKQVNAAKYLHDGFFDPTGRYFQIAANASNKMVIVDSETGKLEAMIDTAKLPHTLLLLDAKDLKPIKLYDVADQKGNSSRVSAVYTAPPRNSFIAAMKDIPEVWEISYDDEPPLSFAGWVHDYNPESGEKPLIDAFPVRRIRVDDYLDDFFFDQEYVSIIGASRAGKGQVVDMDIGRVIVPDLALPGMPHLGSGITWQYQGRQVLATPNLRAGKVSVIDMDSWKTIAEIETLGPGFFMRSHENTPYAWVDVFFGPNKDAVHVIDKRSLEIVKTLRPAPGKTAAHVEFTRDGRYALLSIWDPEGAVVIYDAATLEEVKRIPMNKPSGKYNVYNKITRSAGTSH